MKKLLKKSLAVILTALLLISTVPITVSAAEATADSVGKVFNDNRTRSDEKRAVYVRATFPNGEIWHGSGFIFAKNAVMTAAHLVYKKYCGGIAEYITVYPEGPNGPGYSVTNTTYNSAIIGTSEDDGNWNFDNDWAILKTSNNIGDDYGYFGFSTNVSKSDTLTVMGFPDDKGSVRYTESGKAIQIYDKTISHKISTDYGSSGSVTLIGDVAIGLFVGDNDSYNYTLRIDDFIYKCMMEYRHHYHIKYNANGGKGSMAETVVEYGTTSYLRNNTFTNNNYVFAGWYVHRKSDNKWVYRSADNTDKGWYKEGSQPSGWVKALYSNGCKVSETSSVNDDTVTMYAQWKHFTVKYYPEGGSGSMADTTVYYDVPTNLRNNTFKKAGRHFTGWTAKRRSDNKWCYRNADDTKDGWYLEGKQPSGWVKDIYKNQNTVYHTSSVHEDIVEMHAQWGSPSTYTIYYNANGGKGSMDPTVVTYDVISYLRKNTFTNNNYKFAGWYVHVKSDNTWFYRDPASTKTRCYEEGKQPDGWVKALYTDGCKVSRTSYTDNDIVTMYAQWEAAPSNTNNVIANGTTGDCTWALDEECTLTISGNGAMKNYGFDNYAPWKGDKVKSLIIEEGVTNIGNVAFTYCHNLSSVTIPNSVTSIGSYSFEWCGLDSVTIPDSVRSIGHFAFTGCKMSSVNIPSSVTSIGTGIFSSCSSLTNITVDSDNPEYFSINGNLYNKSGTLIQYAIGKTDSSFNFPIILPDKI